MAVGGSEGSAVELSACEVIDAGPGVGLLLPYVAEQTRRLADAVDRARVEDPDAVHDVRVAARRIRSGLQTFAPDPDPDSDAGEAVRRCVRELRWLGRRLAPSRDAQVQRGRLRSALAELDSTLVWGPVRRRLRGSLDARVGAAYAAAAKALESRRLAELMARLRDLASGSDRVRSEVPASVAVERALRRRWEAVDVAVASCRAGTGGDAVLHRLRKDVKMLRYAVEVTRPLAPERVAAVLDGFGALQDELGRHQDAVVAQDWLLRWAAEADRRGEPTFTYGVLYRDQIEAGRVDLSELESDWRAIRSGLTWLVENC